MSDTGQVTASGKMVLSVLGSIIVAALLWVGTLSAWVIEIRSNRFTARDAIQLRREIMQDVPPPEVLFRLDRLESDVRELEGRHRNGG